MKFTVEPEWIGKEFTWSIEISDGIADSVRKEITMKFSSSCSTSAAGLYTVDWLDQNFKETEKLELGSGARV